MNNFIDKVDVDNTEQISYSQFLSATLTDNHLSENNIKSLFDDLNILGKGYLTKDTLFKTF